MQALQVVLALAVVVYSNWTEYNTEYSLSQDYTSYLIQRQCFVIVQRLLYLSDFKGCEY